ncbi:MAG: ABC transporter substrate-binding protein [Coprobacillus sp.]|nr:ABC transporter substrate-binding protein [Coprobacillus sp.]MCI9092697.1 ABC transporter substrate-binding protein [Coprobacillus sp.]
MKKICACMLALGIMLSGCGSDTSPSEKTKDLSEAKVGVIQLMQHDALDASYEGFEEVLLEAGIKKENIDYQVAGDQANCQTVADKLVNGNNDLIYAIATPALQSVASATNELPIIGCAITDYESTKLVKSNDAPGGNVTGASDLTPIEEQFHLMKQLLPDAKKVAIMYCGSEDNSIFQGNIAEQVAKDNGYEYKVYKVSDSNDIQVVTEKIVSDKMDVIYIPTDNLLATYMSSVEAVASPAKIPCIVGEEGMCKSGGFATYGINYKNLGKLAGQQAVAILKGEKTAADTPIAQLKAEDCTMVINLKVAKKCGLSTNKADYPKEANFIE